MSLSHETLLELMSLADGELDGPDKERVERLLESDDEARQVVASLRGDEVGAWLAETMDRRAGASGADGVADAVMASIAGPAAVAAGGPNGASSAANVGSVARGANAWPALTVSGGKVASLAAARARRSPRLQLVASAGAAALALAAGVALYVRAGTRHLDEHAPVASVFAPAVDVEAASAVAQRGVPGAGGGVEVNEIDAPSRGVSVFEIPVGAAAAVAKPSGASSIVVWVDDDPGSN